MADVPGQQIHPGLRNSASAIAAALGLTDRSELEAALQDLQVLLDLCGYHRRLANLHKAYRHRRPVRRRRAMRSVTLARGRPLGAANFAARQYGLGLAMIWYEQTGRQPSRYRPPSTGKASYVRFVELIVNVVPPSSRRAADGVRPSAQYLVRSSIREFKEAMLSPAENRRRGLIDEQHWLPADPAT